MSTKIIAIACLFILSGAGHFWQMAQYNALDADCERRINDAKDELAEAKQAHQDALTEIRNAHTEALQAERERAAKARQEAEAYVQERDESRARAAALRGRLADLSDSSPADCTVPADRVQLLRDAARSGSGDRPAEADATADDADAAVPEAAGAE